MKTADQTSHGHSTVIESLGVYLPPHSVSTERILEGCRKKIRFPLERITGIKARPMAGEQEFSIDLARRAVEDCFSRSRYSPSDIDLLICCNISRYDGARVISFEPSTSVRLRDHFGFTGAVAFDLTNACAGLFTGIYLLDAFIASGAVRRGMAVSGEYITHLTTTAQQEIDNFMDTRLACLTLGDSGAALILEKAPHDAVGFQAIDLQTFGRYSRYCIAGATDQPHGGMIMHTDAVPLSDVGIRYGADHAIRVLRNAGWNPGSFQHVIMHQTSTMTMNSARREINHLLKASVCDDRNTINNLEQRGNTASTSHFVAVRDAIRARRIRSGDRAVFSINASGLTVGTALYAFDDLPERLENNGSAQPVSKGEKRNEKANAHTREPGPRLRIESVGTLPLGSSDGEDTLAMLRRAATLCLEHSSHQPCDIDLLIYAGVYRSKYVLEPAYASLLAGELDLSAVPPSEDGKKTLAFDVFNGAVGFLNGCNVVQELIRAGKCKGAMVAAAETENNAETFPDHLLGVQRAASSVVLDVDPEGREGFSSFQFGYRTDLQRAYRTHWTLKEGKACLQIEKERDIEEMYIAAVVPTVREFLLRTGVTTGEISKIFPPQISTRFIRRLSEALEIPYERFVDVAGSGPDLFSSSLPYAFHHARQNRLVERGDIALVVSVGSGIQTGCALYYF